MLTGELLRVSTNAQLLNQLVGTHYKQWYKSTYQLKDDTMIWMIRLDNQLRSGWCNKLENGKIIEEFYGNDQPPNIYLGIQIKKRLVFEKTSNGYRFLGVYQFDDAKSNLRHRELAKIADTYIF